MIDTRINNRYLIKNELGRGGMGVVYLAHDTLLERDVAVKVLWNSALGVSEAAPACCVKRRLLPASTIPTSSKSITPGIPMVFRI